MVLSPGERFDLNLKTVLGLRKKRMLLFAPFPDVSGVNAASLSWFKTSLPGAASANFRLAPKAALRCLYGCFEQKSRPRPEALSRSAYNQLQTNRDLIRTVAIR